MLPSSLTDNQLLEISRKEVGRTWGEARSLCFVPRQSLRAGRKHGRGSPWHGSPYYEYVCYASGGDAWRRGWAWHEERPSDANGCFPIRALWHPNQQLTSRSGHVAGEEGGSPGSWSAMQGSREGAAAVQPEAHVEEQGNVKAQWQYSAR